MKANVDGDPYVYWAALSKEVETPQEAADFAIELFNTTLDSVFATDYRIAVKGKGNYRTQISADYKAHRKGPDENKKPLLKAAHSALMEEFNAVRADGMEADDLTRIWCEEDRKAKIPFVLVHEDKDLNMIAGPHYNPKKNLLYHVTDDEADLWFHKQLLMGDNADNIKGLYRVGPKKVETWLSEVAPKNRLDFVIKKWQEYHPDDWYERLLTCGQLIHIKRTIDDNWELPKGIN